MTNLHCWFYLKAPAALTKINKAQPETSVADKVHPSGGFMGVYIYYNISVKIPRFVHLVTQSKGIKKVQKQDIR